MCQDSLGCSNYEMVEFRTLKRRKKSRNHDCTTDFRRAAFDLVMDLLGRIPQDTYVGSRRVGSRMTSKIKNGPSQ